jgi:hypothetical protein
MSDLTDAIHTYLTTAPASGFAGQPVRVLDAWRGEENLLWRVTCEGDEAVVKLFLDAGQARGRRQFDGQQLFAEQGIAPAPLWFDRYPEGLARQVLIYRWMPGDPLDAPVDDAAVTALAATVVQVHQTPPETVRRFSPRPATLAYFWNVLSGSFPPTQRWLEQCARPPLQQAYRVLTQAAQDHVAATLANDDDVHPTPIHGHLKLENCLNHAGQVFLLDWEMFGLGDPAQEVAELLHAQRTAWSSATHHAFVATYCSQIADPSAARRIERYAPLLLLRDLVFLLDGVRRSTAEERADPALVAAMPTLIETLRRACVAVGEALGEVGIATRGAAEVGPDLLAQL